MGIPELQDNIELPVGEYLVSLREVEQAYGLSTPPGWHSERYFGG